MPFEFSEIAIFLVTGAVAGLIAGLFGVGGGMILVPILVMIFAAQGFAEAWLIHLALGSSLAVIVMTASSSIWAHHRHGAVLWPVFRQMLPGIVIGALAGGWVASRFHSDHLITAFGIVELLIAARLLLAGQPGAGRQMPSTLGFILVAVIIGVLSALAGIGGGTLTVPFLLFCAVPMRNAVATSAACGLPIAFFGAAGYAWVGWGLEALPVGATGFVYWPAVICLVVTSMLLAPLGARLAHRLPPLLLRRLFALLLALLGLKMLTL